jgi:peroxiredoxin
MDEFKKRGVTVAGVVVDPVETNAQLQRDAGLEFPILSDPDFRLIDAYGSGTATRTTARTSRSLRRCCSTGVASCGGRT